jgi:tol-pal system protein YbgF
MTKRWIPIVAVALAWTVTPAAAQSRAERQIMADIRMLQEQSQQLAITLAALQDSMKSLNSRIDQSDEATRKGLADQRLVVENMGADLRVIRDRTSETNVRINTLSQELDAVRSQLLSLAATIQTAQMQTTPVDPNVPVDPNAPPPPPIQPPSSTVGLSPTRMYEAAMAEYAAGQWTLAITGFDQFLKAFPTSENADDAQYYIGETYYISGKYPEAVAALNQLIQNYPKGDKVADAYHRRGSAQERMKDLDAARESWEFVIKNYPDSNAAQLAKQNLDRIGSTKKPGAQ